MTGILLNVKVTNNNTTLDGIICHFIPADGFMMFVIKKFTMISYDVCFLWVKLNKDFERLQLIFH